MKNLLFFIFYLFTIQNVNAQEFNWLNPVRISSEDLYSIYFLNEHIGWAVGENGTILKTTDRGFIWIKQNSGISEPINSIFFIDSLTGWATSGWKGTILNTNNGGDNWEIQYLISDSIESSINSIFFSGPDTGFAIGYKFDEILYEPLILKTTTGGEEWVILPHESTGFFLSEYHFFNSESAIIVGGNDTSGVILRTYNGGQNWELIKNEEIGPILKASFINEDIGWALADYNKIIKTTNGGITWSTQDTVQFGLCSIKFVNDSIGWVGCVNSDILHTSNGGTVWEKERIPGDNVCTIYDLFFLNHCKGYAIGSSQSGWEVYFGGYFWRYGDLTRINNQDISILEISSCDLFNNYPNPFNTVTRISFFITTSESVTLKIFDSQGELIETLYSGKLYAGKHNYEWDAKFYSSGIYFYQLQTSKYTKAKKLLLLK
ncbi:MAG: T9SS type A sorting domain-containing protein [Bacteroidales bacterium]|nr:T9SS type A sorting domain-containing protein [Bacteroidales bacterium]